jgi:hypothetical protein
VIDAPPVHVQFRDMVKLSAAVYRFWIALAVLACTLSSSPFGSMEQGHAAIAGAPPQVSHTPVPRPCTADELQIECVASRWLGDSDHTDANLHFLGGGPHGNPRLHATIHHPPGGVLPAVPALSARLTYHATAPPAPPIRGS